MKKSILLALVATLAFAVGFGSVATAGTGDSAQASKKGKAKGCKGKKGKGKGKGCKGKGKAPSWPPADGTYSGGEGVGLTIRGGGKKATLEFAGGDSKTCVPLPIDPEATSVTTTKSTFKASGASSSSIAITWSITVTPGLQYRLVIDSSYTFPDQDPCDKPGVEFKGKLTKAG